MQADIDALVPARERFSSEEFEAFDRAQASPELTDALSNEEARHRSRTSARRRARWIAGRWRRHRRAGAGPATTSGSRYVLRFGPRLPRRLHVLTRGQELGHSIVRARTTASEGTAEFGSRVGRWSVCGQGRADCSFWAWNDLKSSSRTTGSNSVDIGPLLREGHGLRYSQPTLM